MMAYALAESCRSLLVFLLAVLLLMMIFRPLDVHRRKARAWLYQHTRIALWTLVTLTTIGYGDRSPRTRIDQAIASRVIILSYTLITIQTDMVTVELARSQIKQHIAIGCPGCLLEGHAKNAVYCRRCSEPLLPYETNNE
ncbi:MAG: potassium channel family protein [Gallionella sp.]